jgi:nitroreductase
MYSLGGFCIRFAATPIGKLDRFNSSWAQHASALVVVLSDSMMPGDGNGPDKRSRSHRFDAGAAWTQLALQATALGYQAHAMAGLDFEKSQGLLGVPERFRIEVAIAIGRQADPANLPAQLRDREKPSGRLPISQIAFAGAFPQ